MTENKKNNVPWFKRKFIGLKNQQPKEIPDGLWLKCESCGEIIYRKELARNLWVCSICGYHFRIEAKNYLDFLIDGGTFQEFDAEIASTDPLNFVDSKKYTDRLQQTANKTGAKSAIITGIGDIDSIQTSCGFMEFKFIGGSMGSALGEKVTRAIERAVERQIPLVMVSASGGARMQESILSLMQMAKTGTALTKLHEARLPFISILTNPTTAGVMASYASLGDIILSEPGALLGFAGPRVIQQTIGAELPKGFQSAEFVLEHGFVDLITPRDKLKTTIASLLRYLIECPQGNMPQTIP
ncbi:MAG TPA: acetyl-CoA carboxylase carboxyltransferase subunit beta [candidate division Zixibacteria bacterium]|nr:acetyl-CoA carboxylase carboxyltransferase subunit beta [candidate division Zixibacteria bacterium]